MDYYLELMIKDEVVETVPLDLSRYRTYEARWSRIRVMCEWLRYKYAQSIYLVPNWRIELVAGSKMNLLTDNEIQ